MKNSTLSISDSPSTSRASRRRRRPASLHLALCIGITITITVGIGSGALVGCGALNLERTDSNAAVESDGDDRVAVIINGRSISVTELDEQMKNSFLEELLHQPEARIYGAREKAIRELLQKTVVEAEADLRGLTPETLFEEIVGQVPTPTAEDVANWYKQNQSRLRSARLEDVSGQIEQLLHDKGRENAWKAFLDPKLEALDFEFVLEPPRQDLKATHLVRGDVNAPVTIMTFSDYQCPYCTRSESVLAEVLSRYPEQVRLVHRHFPIDSIHPFARQASEAAMCADEQGKFWEFHDAIFGRSGKLQADSFRLIGAELELDGEALGACISAQRYAEFVQQDVDAGRAAGVTGTPAFFVNGIALEGARDVDSLSRVVDSELARVTAN